MDIPLFMGKEREDFCVLHDCHEMVTSIEEAFKNQVDKSTHPLNTSQSLPLATPVIVRWAREQIDHCGKEWRLYVSLAI